MYMSAVVLLGTGFLAALLGVVFFVEIKAYVLNRV